MAKTESIVEAWQLTLDEYKQRPDATEPENGSVLAINLKHETSDSMQRFSGRELSALALLTGARRNGKKAVVIESIFSRHRALVALEKETPESLVGLKVGQIDALLKAAGLPASYGNKATKAQKLIGWRARIRTKAKDRLTQSLHLLEVSNALKSLKYHRAIAEGKMTVERATLIISSHGLDVPKNINAPLETKRKGGRATRALENAEIQAVFASVGGRYAVRNRAMLMVGIHLALRATELCGLTVGDVYDGARVRTYITIRGEIAKRSRERTIRIGDTVKTAIADFIKWKSEHGQSLEADAPLFVSQMGGHISRITLFVIVKGVLRRAGIEESPHCLRKTGATIYYQQSDYDLMATQSFLGHSDPSVTRQYIGITPKQASEYAQRSDAHLQSAIETGEMEKLNTLREIFHFPNSGVDAKTQRLTEELERKDQIIDRLTRMLETPSDAASRSRAVNEAKTIPFDQIRRSKQR